MLLELFGTSSGHLFSTIPVKLCEGYFHYLFFLTRNISMLHFYVCVIISCLKRQPDNIAVKLITYANFITMIKTIHTLH